MGSGDSPLRGARIEIYLMRFDLMRFFDIVMLGIIALILVLFIKNPQGAAINISSAGNVLTGESRILTGQGYSG